MNVQVTPPAITVLPKNARAMRCGARVPARSGQTTPQSTPASSQPTTETPASI